MHFSNHKSEIINHKSAAFVDLLAAVAIIVALLAEPAGAANYYVSTTGSNANAGTSLASPFLTIQQAANVAQAGDNVYVRGGTYRETVTVAHSGTSGSPITFQPYRNEPVTVTGLDVLSSSWSPYSGSTYQANVTGGASQVFVGGQMMTEARFPDAGYNNPLHANRATVGSASVQPAPNSVEDHRHRPGPAPATGPAPRWRSMLATNGPRGARPSPGQTGNTLGFQWPYNSDTYHAPTAGNPYYLYGSLNALNAPKEWYYDASASKLYLQAPGSVNPSGQTVEVRKREYGFDLGSQSYVNLQGFCLKAANVRVAGNNNLVNNCQILYPEPLTDATGSPSNPGVQISGQYNTVQNSEIAYAWGDGVTLSNGHNTVSNNVIHDVAWLGNGAFVNGFGAGGNNTHCQQHDVQQRQQRRPLWQWRRSQHADSAQRHLPLRLFQQGSRRDLLLERRQHRDRHRLQPHPRQRGDQSCSVNAGIYLDNNAGQTSSGVTIHHNLTVGIQTGSGLERVEQRYEYLQQHVLGV